MNGIALEVGRVVIGLLAYLIPTMIAGFVWDKKEFNFMVAYLVGGMEFGIAIYALMRIMGETSFVPHLA